MKKSNARVVAIESGQRVYVPEQACHKGHFLRYVSGSCIECANMRGAEYRSRDVGAYNARKRKEREKHRKLLAAKAAEARKNESAEQRKRRLAKAAEAQRKWRAANAGRASIAVAKAAYKAKNPEKTRALTAKRRAALQCRIPPWTTPDDLWIIEEAHALAVQRTSLTGIVWHVDHIVPLQGRYVSGLHVPNNIQVIPWIDNVRKANKYLPA